MKEKIENDQLLNNNDNLIVIEKYIDSKFRVNNLDMALLYTSTLISLFFALLNSLFGTYLLITFLPLLSVGLIIPIWVGFVKGSITLDRPEERTIGWIYLIIGTSTYVCLFIISMIGTSTIIRDYVKNTWIQVIIYLIFILILIFVFTKLVIYLLKNTFKISNRIFKICGKQLKNEKSYSAIFASVMYSCMASFVVSLSLYVFMTKELDWPQAILSILIFILLFIITFLRARRYYKIGYDQIFRN